MKEASEAREVKEAKEIDASFAHSLLLLLLPLKLLLLPMLLLYTNTHECSSPWSLGVIGVYLFQALPCALYTSSTSNVRPTRST